MTLDKHKIAYLNIGYRKRLYDSIKYIHNIIGDKLYFVYKGAAINLFYNDYNNSMRGFRDIDIWVEPEAKKIIRKKEDSDGTKIILTNTVFGIDYKSVLDIKSGEKIEDIIPINMVLDNLIEIQLEDIRIKIPTLEMQMILMIAHKIKHERLKDNREHFLADSSFFVDRIKNRNKVYELARKLSILEEVNNIYDRFD